MLRFFPIIRQIVKKIKKNGLKNNYPLTLWNFHFIVLEIFLHSLFVEINHKVLVMKLSL